MRQRYCGTFGGPALGLVGALALSGCGGGGSGGGADFNGFSQIRPNDVVSLTGQAATADFVVSETSGAGALSNVAGAPAKLTGVYQNGELVALRGETQGLPFDIDRRDGDYIEFDGTALYAEDEASGVSLIYLDAGSGFEYQTFGLWTQGETRGRIAAASTGGPTQVSDMPTGLTASYSGFANGLTDVGGTVSVTVAGVALRTDFRSATLAVTDTMRIDLATTRVSAAPDHDLSGTLQVTGNGLSGNVTSGVGRGSAVGTFYGPGAAEVGGVYAVSGGRGSYVGSFGAAR